MAEPTVQLLLRVSPELKKQIEDAAKENQRSINFEATQRLEESFPKDQMRMSFGELLHFYRKRMNLTQGQLADAVGISRTQVSNYEKNITTEPVSDNLIKIAKVLGVDPEFLLYGEPSQLEEKSHNDLSYTETDELMAELANRFNKLGLQIVLQKTNPQ